MYCGTTLVAIVLSSLLSFLLFDSLIPSHLISSHHVDGAPTIQLSHTRLESNALQSDRMREEVEEYHPLYGLVVDVI